VGKEFVFALRRESFLVWAVLQTRSAGAEATKRVGGGTQKTAFWVTLRHGKRFKVREKNRHWPGTGNTGLLTVRLRKGPFSFELFVTEILPFRKWVGGGGGGGGRRGGAPGRGGRPPGTHSVSQKATNEKA